eukprot:s3482_g2.t1
MADMHHIHDTHAGNILVSLSSKLPAVRWHDVAGNFGSAARRDVAQTVTDAFARQIEDFSGTVISQISETHQGFASGLNETCKTCSMVGKDMIWVRQCLRQRAFDLASTMLSLSALQTLEKQRLLESIAPALSDSDARVLWRHWSEGTRVRSSPDITRSPLAGAVCGRAGRAEKGGAESCPRFEHCLGDSHRRLDTGADPQGLCCVRANATNLERRGERAVLRHPLASEPAERRARARAQWRVAISEAAIRGALELFRQPAVRL